MASDHTAMHFLLTLQAHWYCLRRAAGWMISSATMRQSVLQRTRERETSTAAVKAVCAT